MRTMKWIGIAASIYIIFVLLFDGIFISLNQAELEGTGIPMLVITTTDESGEQDSRRLARFESDGKLYVSAHHWWRDWYHRAVANPKVRVEIDGVEADYVAVPVEGAEFDQVAEEFRIGFVPRFLMGFPPPRDILRLDPA